MASDDKERTEAPVSAPRQSEPEMPEAKPVRRFINNRMGGGSYVVRPLRREPVRRWSEK